MCRPPVFFASRSDESDRPQGLLKFLWVTCHDSPRACKVFFEIDPEGLFIDVTDQIDPEGLFIDVTDQIDPEGLFIDVTDQIDPEGIDSARILWHCPPTETKNGVNKMAILIFLMGFLIAACGLAFILENF